MKSQEIKCSSQISVYISQDEVIMQNVYEVFKQDKPGYEELKAQEDVKVEEIKPDIAEISQDVVFKPDLCKSSGGGGEIKPGSDNDVYQKVKDNTRKQ